MNRYTKQDVEFHSASYYGRGYPAVNVKVYHYPSTTKVMDTFHCEEDTAQKALNFAFEMSQETFWNKAAPEIVKDIFGSWPKMYSAGRSSGWLIVTGLKEFEFWDAIDLSKWHSFENQIKSTIKYLCQWENVKTDIEANRWAEDGAEQYNFYQFENGHSECIVDLKNSIPVDARKALSI